MSIPRVFHLSLMTLLVGFILLPPNLVSAFEDIANSAIETAETAIISAYEVVVEAEHAGGDVTGLLANLTEARDLLAIAQKSYRSGDFDKAVYFADLCTSVGDDVKTDAEELRFQAYRSQDFNMELRITVSLVSMVVVGLCGFWGWQVFERRYHERVLEMKPEMVSNES